MHNEISMKFALVRFFFVKFRVKLQSKIYARVTFIWNNIVDHAADMIGPIASKVLKEATI